jgi:PAP2 superfamily
MRQEILHITLVTTLLLLPARAWTEPGKTSPDDVPSEVAWTWFEQLYDVVRRERTPPPPASRIYGITAGAMYESIAGGTSKNRSLAGQLNGLTAVPQPSSNETYHWPAVANAVLANAIRGLYPSISDESLDAINNLEAHFASQHQAEVPEAVYRRSVEHGEAVARAILEWAATDGFSTFNNCPYAPAAVPGAWEPTPPSFNPNPLQPCWGLIRPMILSSGEECPPPGHPPYSTQTASDFHAAGLEVYTVSGSLTTEQKTIADYWADGPGDTGTPPGHWIAIVSQRARNTSASLTVAAESYARVGIAVHDAFIRCWGAKYFYNLQRPVTYINDNIDAEWRPYIVTPAFPTYTSGHSTQSAAAARALTQMFGIRGFTDTTHTDHGLTPAQEPRTFASFNEAAAEAAVSRLYGGIHFTFDNDDGLVSGHCIADKIRDRVQFKRGRGHDDDNFDDDDKRDDVDPDDDNDGSPDDQDLDDDNDGAADAADRDDDNDGIDDQFDSESTREDQRSIDATLPGASENVYDLVADSSALLLIATAEGSQPDALVQVEIYSPSGTLLAASPPTAGRAVALTIPSLAGIYKVKVKNLGQGLISYETLLITRTNWLSGQLE